MDKDANVKIVTHKDLKVWQKSMDLVVTIYQVSSNFPSGEKYGLTSQMRRSAVSIPSNISEGAARNSTKEYIRFLYIALGSLSELETQLMIANRLEQLNNRLDEEITELRKMLIALIKKLEQKI